MSQRANQRETSDDTASAVNEGTLTMEERIEFRGEALKFITLGAPLAVKLLSIARNKKTDAGFLRNALVGDHQCLGCMKFFGSYSSLQEHSRANCKSQVNLSLKEKFWLTTYYMTNNQTSHTSSDGNHHACQTNNKIDSIQAHIMDLLKEKT